MINPGRNDLCPCGSNKKYKRCCGANAQHHLTSGARANIFPPEPALPSKVSTPSHVHHEKVAHVIQSAIAYQQSGKLQQAAVLCRKVLDIQPRNVDALHLLGIVSCQTGNLTEAIELIERAITVKPIFPEAYCSLSNALKAQGRLEDAAFCYRRALALQPDFANAHHGLGEIFQTQCKLGEAEACYEAALKYQPKLVVTHNNLGNVMQAQGRLDEAIACFQRALDIKPDFAGAHYNLGNVFYEKGCLEEAVRCFRQALLFKPNFASSAHYNLAIALSYQGRLQEAIFNYRQALALKADFYNAHSGILCALNNMSEFTPEAIAAEHMEFDEQHARPLAGSIRTHRNDKDPDRKLRIGYVSPDFCAHSCAFFIEPLLEQHNHSEVEVFCYAEVAQPDSTTKRLQGFADYWRSTVGISDEAVAEMIRQDRIDILIDLAGHTDKNRLMVFARKPAPVQLAWLGYPNTTGLETIDYRFTDVHADPLGTADRLHSEKLVRLPRSFLCYRPPQDSPPISVLPLNTNGNITFASFNANAKVTPEVVVLWSRILSAVPGAQLLLKARSFSDAATRDRYLSLFVKQGIAPERISLLHWIPSRSSHLDLYNQVDIALDPFPYNGTTTTCEALWMGVPMVTFKGDRHSARVGTSLLAQVGLDDLIADSHDAYVNKAVALANDTQRLESLRRGLRQQMQESPLCDAAGFCRETEAAYRSMWRTWCLG